jgi:large subunit ribosomal protein L31e
MSEQKMEALTRVYVVPLGIAFEAAPYRRAKVAVRILKDFTKRHMKATEVNIKEDVNKAIWAHGIRHPPRRIKVEMERDEDGIVTVRLAPEPEQV